MSVGLSGCAKKDPRGHYVEAEVISERQTGSQGYPYEFIVREKSLEHYTFTGFQVPIQAHVSISKLLDEMISPGYKVKIYVKFLGQSDTRQRALHSLDGIQVEVKEDKGH